jgi:bifunctional non-homologous end joining protein LigD
MVPLKDRISHDEAHRYAKRLAERIARLDPMRFTLAASPGARSGKIFIDYLRNGRGTTAVGTYSPRARVGFPLAAPVTWKQIEHGIRPDAFTIKRSLNGSCTPW